MGISRLDVIGLDTICALGGLFLLVRFGRIVRVSQTSHRYIGRFVGLVTTYSI